MKFEMLMTRMMRRKRRTRTWKSKLREKDDEECDA